MYESGRALCPAQKTAAAACSPALLAANSQPRREIDGAPSKLGRVLRAALNEPPSAPISMAPPWLRNQPGQPFAQPEYFQAPVWV